MYTLFVSYNAGCTYHQEQQSDNLDDFRGRCDQLDEQWLRWYVEDDMKRIHSVSDMHLRILQAMEAINEQNTI